MGTKPNESGLSLLELVLALTLLALILLGTTTLESSVVRLHGTNFKAQEMQNQMSYAYRIFEQELGDSELVKIDRLPDPTTAPALLVHWYQWRLRPLGGNPDGSNDIAYEIDLRGGANLFRKTAAGVTQNLIPPGSLRLGPLKYPVTPNNQLALWTNSNLKLWTMNLGLDLALPDGRAVAMPGYGRSFLIRIARVQDCRSGTCIG
jgi:hypothetical protein